jgi:hypothetical protein
LLAYYPSGQTFHALQTRLETFGTGAYVSKNPLSQAVIGEQSLSFVKEGATV